MAEDEQEEKISEAEAIQQGIIYATEKILELQNRGVIPWAEGEADQCTEISDHECCGGQERCVLKSGHPGPHFNGELDGDKGFLWMSDGVPYDPKE